MKRLLGFYIIAIVFFSCNKHSGPQRCCNIQQEYEDNSKKATITNGIWGTVAFMEGNCMPPQPAPPECSDCKTCPVRRTIRIYEYTMPAQAIQHEFGAFYDSFSTQLIKEFETDDNGFFQVDIPVGRYTITVVENGRLYTFGWDQQGAISSVTYAGGKQKVDLTLTYKASF